MRRYGEISLGTFERERATALAQKIKRTPHFAQLLINRGIDTPSKYMKWNLVSTSNLRPAHLLPDIDKAINLLNETIERQQMIMICGDYDADGICATAILMRGLQKITEPGLVTYWIPKRGDGYGFSSDEVDEAVKLGVSLIVTVDCGSTNSEAVAYAHAQGIKVIVTDHHHPGTIDPGAEAFINPQRNDSQYPEKSICGAVVAWKLLDALYASRQMAQPQELLDFAGFATITDMMPLHGENRILGRLGLAFIGRWDRPCLRALGDISGVLSRPIDAKAISFFMGPRLNAVGRVGDPARGLELLLSDDTQTCRELAQFVEDMNSERRKQQDKMVAEVEKRLDIAEAQKRGFIFEWGEWNTGIVGIAAGMLMNKYRIPCLMGRLEGDVIKGSGRSPAGTSLHGAFVDCADVLETFGGHAAAAGFAVRLDKVEEFSERFAAALPNHYQPVPPKFVDFELNLKDIDLKFISELRDIEPTGMEAPSPCFLVRGVRFGNLREMKGGRYIGGTVFQDDQFKVKMVAFAEADELRRHQLLTQKCDIVCSLDIDTFGGSENPSLTIDYAVAANQQQLESLDRAEGKATEGSIYTEKDFQPVTPIAECPVAIALPAESQAAMIESLRNLTALVSPPRPQSSAPSLNATATADVEAVRSELKPEGSVAQHRLFDRGGKDIGELFPKIAAYLQSIKVPLNRETAAVIVALDTKIVPASVAERVTVLTWKEWQEKGRQGAWSDVFLLDPPLDIQSLRESGLLKNIQRLYTFFNDERWEAVQTQLADWVIQRGQMQRSWELISRQIDENRGQALIAGLDKLAALLQLKPHQSQIALTIMRECHALTWERWEAEYHLCALPSENILDWELSPLFKRLNRSWQSWEATRRELAGSPLTERSFWPAEK